MRVLVTGAAGFIGSVVTAQLLEAGHDVVALDSLKNGHSAAVVPQAQFVKADLLDADGLKRIVASTGVDAVIHLAAEALIKESVRDPGLFFRVNTVGGLNLLEAMLAAGVPRLIFSSTAAVYGEPEATPIPEDARCLPVNAYGESKLAFERMLPWYARAHDLRSTSLRYFNACGATDRYGEDHRPETHLIPILLEVALGQRDAIDLYGTDYDTPDGTCIRDYIHVDDIAHAHLLALDNVDAGGARAYNMGNGRGYSNREVIDAVREVTGREIRVNLAARRPGDPARLVASDERIRAELGWEPRYPELKAMIETAWAWRQQHPNGYAR
jgi:UDP-glucose 4-epimerase